MNFRESKARKKLMFMRKFTVCIIWKQLPPIMNCRNKSQTTIYTSKSFPREDTHFLQHSSKAYILSRVYSIITVIIIQPRNNLAINMFRFIIIICYIKQPLKHNTLSGPLNGPGPVSQNHKSMNQKRRKKMLVL